MWADVYGMSLTVSISALLTLGLAVFVIALVPRLRKLL